MSRFYQLNAQPSLRRKASLKDHHKYPSPPKRKHENSNHRALGLVSFVAAVLPESFFIGPGQMAVPWEEFRLFQLGDFPTFSVWIFLAFTQRRRVFGWQRGPDAKCDSFLRKSSDNDQKGFAYGCSWLCSSDVWAQPHSYHTYTTKLLLTILPSHPIFLLASLMRAGEKLIHGA